MSSLTDQRPGAGSPGALTCAKLGRFVHDVSRIIHAQSTSHD